MPSRGCTSSYALFSEAMTSKVIAINLAEIAACISIFYKSVNLL